MGGNPSLDSIERQRFDKMGPDWARETERVYRRAALALKRKYGKNAFYRRGWIIAALTLRRLARSGSSGNVSRGVEKITAETPG